MIKPKNSTPANIVWFEIPADDAERAKKFYRQLFGWKIHPFRGMTDYSYVETGGPAASPDGGLMLRKHPTHVITNYILVPSVTRFMTKVEKLGGRVCQAKTSVPQMGYFAVCQDTENNTFGLWERNPRAK